MDLTGDGLFKWLSVRSLPHNRKYARELCSSLGFSIDDVESIYEVSLGLSLNDSYWVPLASDERRFAEVNLYENGFSEVLAAVAYTGQEPLGAGGTPHGLTPELTTDGTLRKAWRIRGGNRLLYKGSSNDWYPGEPASELFASYIAEEAGLFSVRYGLDVWQGELCSVCPCFCSPYVSYTPFAVATGVTDMGLMMGVGALLGLQSFESLCDMVVFDSLIWNEDRHFTNFGILRNADDGSFLRLAPIFDNGRGLLPMLRTDQLDDCGAQLSVMSPAFGARTFDANAARVIGPRQVAWLDRVASLDLCDVLGIVSLRADRGELKRRAEALTPLVQERAKALSSLPVQDHAAMCEILSRSAEDRLKPSKMGSNEPLRIYNPSVLQNEPARACGAMDINSSPETRSKKYVLHR